MIEMNHPMDKDSDFMVWATIVGIVVFLFFVGGCGAVIGWTARGMVQ